MSCINCGNHLVSHRFTWFNETMLVCFTPLNRWFSNRWFYRSADKLVDKILLGLAYGLKSVGILRFNSDSTNFKIARAAVLWAEANSRGYKMENAEILGRPMDFYRVKLPGQRLHFTGLPRPKDAPGGGQSLAWMDDKAIVKKKLTAAGIAVPAGGSFSDFGAAARVFATLNKPVIVKPRLGSRARHTTTNVFTLEQLREAFQVAQELCHWVMVEEQIAGNVYRGTVIGGKLVGVFGISPPNVTGNGAQTIRELINKTNAQRDPRVSEIIITPELTVFISRLGFDLDTVLPTGKKVELGRRMGENYGGASFELDAVHPELTRELEKAADVINDPIIGFDFIIPDPMISPQDQRWGIIEANGMPFIQLHHTPLYGTPKNIARHVWNLFDHRA